MLENMEVVEVGEDVYEVHSDGKTYFVIFDNNGEPACTCRGYWYNGHCKHIDAVMEWRKNHDRK